MNLAQFQRWGNLVSEKLREEKERSHSCRSPMRSVPPRGSGWVRSQLLNALVIYAAVVN